MARLVLLLATVTLVHVPSSTAQELQLPAQILPVPDALWADAAPIASPPSALGGDDEAYGDLYNFGNGSNRLARFLLSNATTVVLLQALTASSYAGSWVPDLTGGGPGYLYEMALVGTAWYLLRRSLTTYQTDMVVEAPLPAGMGWTGMAYSVALAGLFAIATDCAGLHHLYRINLQTGALTLLTTLATAICLVSFAIGAGDWGLALDTETDRLYRINLTALTIVALAQVIGYNTGFAQGMGYSGVLDRFFLGTIHTPTALEHGPPVGQLRMADVDGNGDPTGATTLLGLIGNGSEEALYLTFLTPASTAVAPGAPTHQLSGAVPNPFYPETVLTLRVVRDQRVRVELFDALGRRIESIYDGLVPAGAPRTFHVDVRGLRPGAYVVRVTGETFADTRLVTVAGRDG